MSSFVFTLIFLIIVGRFLHNTMRWLLRRWWRVEDTWVKTEALVVRAQFVRKEEGRSPSLGIGYRRFDLGTPSSYIYDTQLEYRVNGRTYSLKGEFSFLQPIEERRALDIVYQKKDPSIWEYAEDRLVESEEAKYTDKQMKAWWIGLLMVPSVIFLALLFGLRYHGFSLGGLRAGLGF